MTAQIRNNRKYCEYHKDKGHTTNECRALAKVLLEHSRTKTNQINLINKASTSKTIFTITADTNTKRSLEILTINQPAKRPRLKLESISFSAEDLEGIETPHQDPLVISTILNDYTVQRILIDTGASIDILYWDTFKNMNLKEEDLTICHCPVKGFGQVKIPVVGW